MVGPGIIGEDGIGHFGVMEEDITKENGVVKENLDLVKEIECLPELEEKEECLPE